MDADKANAMLGISDDEVEVVMEDTPTPKNEIVVAEPKALPATEVLSDDTKRVDEIIDFAQEKIKEAMEKIEDTLDDAANVAKNTGIADSYSAVGSLVSTLTSSAKALVDMETKRHTIRKKEREGNNQQQPTTNITNNLNFKGTTQELLEFIKKQKNGESIQPKA